MFLLIVSFNIPSILSAFHIATWFLTLPQCAPYQFNVCFACICMFCVVIVVSITVAVYVLVANSLACCICRLLQSLSRHLINVYIVFELLIPIFFSVFRAHARALLLDLTSFLPQTSIQWNSRSYWRWCRCRTYHIYRHHIWLHQKPMFSVSIACDNLELFGHAKRENLHILWKHSVHLE